MGGNGLSNDAIAHLLTYLLIQCHFLAYFGTLTLVTAAVLLCSNAQVRVFKDQLPPIYVSQPTLHNLQKYFFINDPNPNNNVIYSFACLLLCHSQTPHTNSNFSNKLTCVHMVSPSFPFSETTKLLVKHLWMHNPKWLSTSSTACYVSHVLCKL